MLEQQNVILTINAGSSNIKFSLFTFETLEIITSGKMEKIGDVTLFSYIDQLQKRHLEKFENLNHEFYIPFILQWYNNLNARYVLKGIGHRVVHGGAEFTKAMLIDNVVIDKLSSLVSLAPLHELHNIEAIKTVRTHFPKIPQVACFDTAFHSTQNKLATLFTIPRRYMDIGVKRYGFHGLSYEFIASKFPEIIDTKKNRKVIVAHLGNGASVCALYDLKSMATSMGFTVLDGLMMGTRSGSIDPGLILYLLQEKKLSLEEMSNVLYEQSGLLGVSGISSDMRELIQNESPQAEEAINLFCYRAAQEIVAFSVILQGCDALIFTAGIGENSPIIRKKICAWLNWLGICLEDNLNEQNQTIISQKDSRILVTVIPTNEEYCIAKHTVSLIQEITA